MIENSSNHPAFGAVYPNEDSAKFSRNSAIHDASIVILSGGIVLINQDDTAKNIKLGRQISGDIFCK